MFFLAIAITQFIPVLKVGFLISYVAPLVFVLAITLIKEAVDDLKWYKRDKEINEKVYMKMKTEGGEEQVYSQNIRVGDIVKINQNDRLPADLLLLYTTHEETANVFIWTDQLDGETDWKLRRSVQQT